MAAMSADTVLVKIDFSNAFNCLRRDRMLKTVADHMPDLYRFCCCLLYTSPSPRDS